MEDDVGSGELYNIKPSVTSSLVEASIVDTDAIKLGQLDALLHASIARGKQSIEWLADRISACRREDVLPAWCQYWVARIDDARQYHEQWILESFFRSRRTHATSGVAHAYAESTITRCRLHQCCSQMERDPVTSGQTWRYIGLSERHTGLLFAAHAMADDADGGQGG